MYAARFMDQFNIDAFTFTFSFTFTFTYISVLSDIDMDAGSVCTRIWVAY